VLVAQLLSKSKNIFHSFITKKNKLFQNITTIINEYTIKITV